MPAPVIGLVGGLGVGATVHYYRRLAAAHDDAREPMRLVMAHASIARTTACASAGDRAGLAEYLSGFLARLRAAGATFGVVPAVTPHICIDQLQAIAPIPLVDLTKAVADHLRARGPGRFALFGTRYVVESDLYGRLPGIDIARPREDEIAFVHDAYSQLAHTGIVSEAHRGRLTALADTLAGRDGVDAIVLAGTDFCLMFTESDTPFPHVDCARVHIAAIRRAAAAPEAMGRPDGHGV